MSNTVISYSTEEFDNETAACKVAKDTALEHYFELVKTSEGNQKRKILRCSRWETFESKGTGKRDRCTSKTGCEYRIIIRHSKRTNCWRICNDNDTHNHEVAVEDLAGIAFARRLTTEQEDDIKNMWISGCFPRQILHQLRQTSPLTQDQDVYNYIQ